MQINEVLTKNIITKSNLPDADFVINPYIGCTHSCIYCYARFMKRFTGHNEKWGDFIDVKINSAETIPKNGRKIKRKSVFMSSVTDPYLHLEKKYQITRKILDRIVTLEPNLNIQTKSSLVLRDIDILKKLSNCRVGMTITTLDDTIRKQIEPNTSSVDRRLSALRQLKESGLTTYIFIGPILPYITDYKQIIEKTKEYVDYYMFENLNTHGTISMEVYNWLEKCHIELLDKYKDVSKDRVTFWDTMETEIKQFCIDRSINYKMYFNHKTQRKK